MAKVEQKKAPGLTRKISAKTLGLDKGVILETCFKDKTATHPLYQVVGIARGLRTGKSKFEDKAAEDQSEWTALLGMFQGTNLLTGEVFRAGVCFMPDHITQMVAGQIDAVDDENAGVKFAFEIGAKFDDKAITSYVFDARSLMPIAADDPLMELQASINPNNQLTDQSK